MLMQLGWSKARGKGEKIKTVDDEDDAIYLMQRMGDDHGSGGSDEEDEGRGPD